MVMFIAVRQSVDMGVMDQRVVAISPGKLLGPDAEVVIRDKWRRLVLRGIRSHESRDVSENDHGASDEEEAGPPPLPVSVSVGARHLPDLGHVGLPQQAQGGAPEQGHNAIL